MTPTLTPNASRWVSCFSHDDTHPHSKRELVGVLFLARRHPPSLQVQAGGCFDKARHQHPPVYAARFALGWMLSRGPLGPASKLRPCVIPVPRRLPSSPNPIASWFGCFDTTPTPPHLCVHTAHFALGRILSRGPLGPTPKLQPCVIQHLPAGAGPHIALSSPCPCVAFRRAIKFASPLYPLHITFKSLALALALTLASTLCPSCTCVVCLQLHVTSFQSLQ
jgi:hypothetical protein